MDGLLPALSPQKEPEESGGSCKVPPDKGVGGVLARDGSPGLVVVAGTMAGWRLEVASAPSGLMLASSQTIHNTLAANCWPWV